MAARRTNNDPAARVLENNRAKFRKPEGIHLQSILEPEWIRRYRVQGVSVGGWQKERRKAGWKKSLRRPELKNRKWNRKPLSEFVYRLELVRLEDIPREERLEAIEMGRKIYSELISTGCLRPFLGLEMGWVEVIATLAMQPPSLVTPAGQVLEFGGFDAAWRYLATGLSSAPRYNTEGNHWQGWRTKLGIDPRFALRESFLTSMRHGWGIRGRYRWEAHPAWLSSRHPGVSRVCLEDPGQQEKPQ